MARTTFPWSPENAEELEAVRTVYAMLKAETARATDSPEQEAILAIKAVIHSEAHRLAMRLRRVPSEEIELEALLLDLLSRAKDTSAR